MDKQNYQMYLCLIYHLGMGMNEAVWDAYCVIKLLKKWKESNHNISISSIINEYHLEMVERTAKTVQRSRACTEFYHTPDAINKEKLYKFKNW